MATEQTVNLWALINQLRTTLGKMELALGAIEDAIVWSGPDHRVQWCNAAFDRLVGVPHIHVLNQPLPQLLPLRQRHDLLEFTAYPTVRLFQGAYYPTIYEYSIEDQQRWLEISGNLTAVGSDEPSAILVIRDVTTARRMEVERQQHMAALRQSEEKFRRIVEHANDILFLLRPDGTFSYNSPNLVYVFGYDTQELLDQPFAPLVHPADLALCQAAFQQVLTTGERQLNIEFRALHKQGHWVWQSASLGLSQDETGEPIVVGVTRDISDRKRSEAERQQREEALRLIVEGTAAHTGAAFFQSCIQYVAHLFQVHVVLITEFVDPARQRIRTLAFWCDGCLQDNCELDLSGTPCEAVLRGEPTYYSHRLRASFPEDIMLAEEALESYLGLPLTSSTGEVIGHIALMDRQPMPPDPTRELILRIFAARAGAELERQQAEAALACAKEAAEAANEAKSQFLATMSHELRTPLSSLIGSLDLLNTGRLGQLNHQGQQLIAIAISNAERLIRLVNDVLDLERVAQGTLRLHKASCNLAELIRQAVATMQGLAAQAQVTLIAEPPDLWLSVDCDRIVQILTNLLSNAIKASDPGDRVWVRVIPQSEYVHIQVQDEGQGIPADKLAVIFQRFQQVDATNRRQRGGAGLGLAICRHLIELHGGRLWAESSLGQGSTFHLQLPR